jgi:cytochrome c-type biogenesis protein CcmE
LCKVDADCDYRFRIADSLASHSLEQLSIRYDGCALPDTFRDFRDVPGIDLELTVEGERCRTCHDFKASAILAKCPGKYEIPLDAGHLRSAPAVPRCLAITPKI